MQLHTLPGTTNVQKKRLGLGHGSGRGKTAGRGTKGQKARTNIPLRFEGGALPLVKRMPFLRGKSRNKSLNEKVLVINLDALNRIPAHAIISVESLITYRIIPADTRHNEVKLLGKGTLLQAYTVHIPTSKSAADKIVKAGGSVEKHE